MRLQAILNRLDKLLQAAWSLRLAQVLLRYRVLAGAEHRQVLARDLATVIDIGANRGQFALAVREWAPTARVISFEPLPGPATIYRRVFSGDDEVVLHQAAIGPRPEVRTMHISHRDDSSSLLPISIAQTAMFPGTGEIATLVRKAGVVVTTGSFVHSGSPGCRGRIMPRLGRKSTYRVVQIGGATSLIDAKLYARVSNNERAFLNRKDK